MRVRVLLHPRDGRVPRGAAAAVIDVLRATTTLTVARRHGASRIVAAATVEQARSLAAALPRSLLCGEREGRRIDGFDLGNSPAEYAFETVSGRTLVFASTNGSQALLAAAPARRRVLAAFVNATAVVEALAAEREVALVCAGKLGGFSLEDAACAGWLATALAARGARLHGPGARLAAALAPRDADGVRATVQGSSHGRYLRRLGRPFAADVELCGALDAVPFAYDA